MINHVASVQLWGLMAVFRRQGEATWEKKGSPKRIAESDCLFPLSKIAHWSILLRGNG